MNLYFMVTALELYGVLRKILSLKLIFVLFRQRSVEKRKIIPITAT